MMWASRPCLVQPQAHCVDNVELAPLATLDSFGVVASLTRTAVHS
jgi:hypothetical protein